MADPTNYNVIVQELVRRSNEDSRRLRAVEQRLDSMENRLSNSESTAIERTKKMNSKFAELDVTIRSLTDELTKLNASLDKLNKQAIKFARKQDLKEMERMLDLISPIKQEFVTKEQLEEELHTRTG